MKPATWILQHRPALDRPRAGDIAAPLAWPRILPRLALLMALVLAAWVGTSQLNTPPALPASAPATVFSAGRAMQHLEVITADSRAIGSPGNAAARAYLIEQLRAMGLHPQVQTTSVVTEGDTEGFGAGTVNNVIARIPGTDSTGAIALDAHYDATSTGPGAGDAGSGVVTVLETVRALLAGPPLRNDLIIVFADGEEAGMLGAAAFNEQHPWARDIRLAVNFEAAGSSGPAILYATSDDDAWLVSEFLGSAPDPRAYSMLPAIHRLMPEARLDCDLGEYTQEGAQGIGFVYAAETSDYHTELDNINHVDPGTIQQEGDYTLSFVRHFGALDLSDLPRASDSVYFNILPGYVLHYATTWVLPLAALITALVAGLVVAGLHRKELNGRGLLAGMLLHVFGTLVVVILAALVWVVVRALNSDYQVKLIGSYQTPLYAAALSIFTFALVVALFLLARRWVRSLNLMAGVLLGMLPALWLTSLAAPGLSYLVVWPLLFGLLPLGWMLLARSQFTQPWVRVAVLAVAALPPIVLLPATLYQVFALVNRYEGITGLPFFGLSMLFVAPYVALLMPQIDELSGEPGARRWLMPAAFAVVALALIGWGNVTSGFDAEHPRPDRIAYALDADTGQARWISEDKRLDAWTSQFFPANPQRGDFESLLMGATVPAYIAPAPVAPLVPPEGAILRDTLDADVRTIDLRLSSPDGWSQVMVVEVRAADAIVAAAVNGMPLDLSGSTAALDGELKVAYFNVDSAGWVLTLSVHSTNAIAVTVEETSDGLPEVPGMTIEPRPADMMPAPGPPRDPTYITRTFSF